MKKSYGHWIRVKDLYVAVAGEDATVVVDNKTMQAVARIPVGAVPKRNTSGLLRPKEPETSRLRQNDHKSHSRNLRSKSRTRKIDCERSDTIPALAWPSRNSLPATATQSPDGYSAS